MWLFDADGKPACLLTSCVPVVDEHGTWQGTRGVCRDVTQARERDAALDRARNRERLLGDIVDAIRTQVEPARMLEEAARATAGALPADHCWILRTDSTGALAGIAQSVRPVEPIPSRRSMPPPMRSSSTPRKGWSRSSPRVSGFSRRPRAITMLSTVRSALPVHRTPDPGTRTRRRCWKGWAIIWESRSRKSKATKNWRSSRAPTN